MNKSKILKRSLAVILAMMMIFAMIPLSASAAEVPALTSVTLNSEAVTVADDMTVEIGASGVASATDVTVAVVLATGSGKLYHNGGMVAEAAGVVSFNPTSAEFAAKKIEFSVWDSDVLTSKSYTLSWTYKAPETDNTIASIGFTDSGKQYGATQLVDGVLTITAKYGTINPAADTLNLKTNAKATVSVSTGVTAGPNNNGTTVISGYTVGTAFKVTVTAENGAARTYTAKVVAPSFFPAFASDGERKAAVVDETNAKITLNLPYEVATVTKAGAVFYEIPVTFSTGYPSATVKTVSGSYPNDATPKAFTSGSNLYVAKTTFETYAEPTPTTEVAVLTYSYNGEDKDFNVLVSKPDKDPKAEISALQIGTYNATIDGSNITVELPASYMGAGVTTASLKIAASVGATVQIVGDAATKTGTGELVEQVATFNKSVESSSIIRVISGWTGDGNAAARTDYNLTVKKVSVSEAATVKAFVLQDPDGEKYTAEIDNTNNLIKVAVPYSTTQAALAAGGKQWKLFYEVSNGAVVSAPAALEASGSKFAAANLTLIPATFDGATKGANLTVQATDNTTKTYNVVVSRLAPATGKEITEFSVTAETAYANLTETNVYAGTIKNKEITVKVPYSVYVDKDFALANKVVPVFEASEGAKVYYLTKGDVQNSTVNTAAIDLEGVTEDAAGVKITQEGTKFNGAQDAGVAGTEHYLTLVVASEGCTALTTFDDNWKGTNAGKFDVYKLYVIQEEEKHDYELKSVVLFDNVTKETVTGKITSSGISFTDIPNHFIADSTALGKVYIDYEITNNGFLAKTAKTPNTNFFAPVEYNDNGSWKAGGAEVVFTATDPVTADINVLYAESEDGGKGANDATMSATMAINYTFAAPEKGAAMTSMTIAGVTGTPDSTNKISITVPFGTEITALKPTWVVSKNAVVYDANHTRVFSGETAFNFTGAQKFVVESEDGLNTSTYTVEVSVADQFSDLDPNKWYYNEIMEAVKKGITVGNGNGTFGPATLVTRGQFAQFLARADGYNAEDYKDKTVFSDVPAGNEQAAAIAYCVEKKYINGYGDTTFKPSANITREQMATILAQFLGLEKIDKPTELFADDAQISGWAKGWVYAVADAKVMVGKGDKFDPKGNATRAEACAVCVRVTK